MVSLNKGLSVSQLDALIGERDHLGFLNTRNVVYRQRKMKLNPPSREVALQLMSEHPNLVRRPISVQGDKVLVGFKPAVLDQLFED